jgi:hypothetical protein
MNYMRIGKLKHRIILSVTNNGERHFELHLMCRESAKGLVIGLYDCSSRSRNGSRDYAVFRGSESFQGTCPSTMAD